MGMGLPEAMNKIGYICIRGTYFCSQQSVLRLLLFILLNRSTRPAFLDFTHMLRLVLHRCRLRRIPVTLELPVRGAWCLRVSNGYKVFDPYTAVVTKVYDESADRPLIAEEIKQQSAIGENDFAPTLLDASEEEAWYQEEMMTGKTGYHFSPTDTRDFMAIYATEVAPILRDLILYHPSTRVKVGAYIEHMPDTIQAEIDRITALDAEAGRFIQAFFDRALAEARAIADEDISLVFAHGDFHLFNLFSTKDGVKLTDWEGIGQQSMLFDLFTYFYSHLWTGKSEDGLVDGVEKGVEELAKQLEPHDESIASGIRVQSDSYRKVYYLERLYGYATTFKRNPKQLLRWIRIYDDFEKDAAKKRETKRRTAVA